jgi:hypothetical protein
VYPPTHTRERVFGFGARFESELEYLFDRGFELPLRFTLARSFVQLRPRALGIAVLLVVGLPLQGTDQLRGNWA